MRAARVRRRRRRAIAPATVAVVSVLAFSCDDCPPEPVYPPLRAAYALVAVLSFADGAPPALPKVFRTDPDGTVHRVYSDTLRFTLADSTYTFSGRVGTQKPGEAEVIARVTSPTPPPRFTRTGPGSYHLSRHISGAFEVPAYQQQADTLHVSNAGHLWRYAPIPGATSAR
jgi:hypothetical protein